MTITEVETKVEFDVISLADKERIAKVFAVLGPEYTVQTKRINGKVILIRYTDCLTEALKWKRDVDINDDGVFGVLIYNHI